MANIMSLIKEMMTLTQNVGALRSDVDKLWAKVENHAERIISLENREELLTERMGTRAVEAVYKMNAEYFNRLSDLEQKFKTYCKIPTQKLPEK